MNRVVQFDETTMSGEVDFDRLLIEFDAQGQVVRELAIRDDGRIVHRYPGTPSLDDHGMMGANLIAIVGEGSSPRAILMESSKLVPLGDFEALWASE